MKIGIIRCQEHSKDCPGTSCFPALYARKGRFTRYGKDEVVELVGFDTCGGCGWGINADKIVDRALRLKKLGAEAIHIGWCLYLWCPFKDLYLTNLKEKVGIPIIEGTHALHGSPPKEGDLHRPLNIPPLDAFDDNAGQ